MIALNGLMRNGRTWQLTKLPSVIFNLDSQYVKKVVAIEMSNPVNATAYLFQIGLDVEAI